MFRFRPRSFILDENKQPVEADFDTSAFFRGDPEKSRVAFTDIGSGGLCVSTVFLGIEHTPFDADGNGCLFETMAFKSRDLDDVSVEGTWRYRTWAEAEKGHAEAVAEIRRRLIRAVH